MQTMILLGTVLAILLCGLAPQVRAQSLDGSTTNVEQALAQWKASNATCRNPTASALEAVGACEQRDTYSKLLSLMAPSQLSSAARTTAKFQRMGGVFVLPATINGQSRSYLIVDSGAANVQIPQEIVEEMKRNGTITDADFLGQRRFILADGSGLQQRVFRLKRLQIGDQTMENVLAAVGPPKSRALLGQSFLRRLSWWKIDNVRNAIEFEFTAAPPP